MTDLHGWITQQIDRVEASIRDAEKEHGRDWSTRWEASGDHFEIIDDSGLLVADQVQPGAASLIALHDPTAVLRRCAADRKILDDHNVFNAFNDGSIHCVGCGVDYESGPLVDNINDCPTLLALAEGHGLTPEILSELDRPELLPRPRPKPRGPDSDTRRVPRALRGPNWRHQ